MMLVYFQLLDLLLMLDMLVVGKRSCGIAAVLRGAEELERRRKYPIDGRGFCRDTPPPAFCAQKTDVP